MLVVPKTRDRSIWIEALRYGDVLDSPPYDCERRRHWYKTAVGEGGFFTERCGGRRCPTCVVDWLVKAVAPSWAAWQGQAERLEFSGLVDWHNWLRRDARLNVRGPNAVPGVLSIPADDGERVGYVPGGALRGIELDTALVADIRKMPLDEPVQIGRAAREPSDSFGTIPRKVTLAQMRAAAEGVGATLVAERASRGRLIATPEQNTAWVAALRAMK